MTSVAPARGIAVVTGPRVSLSLPEAEDVSPIEPGTTLEGKYLLLEELGRGSMGSVFLAEDIILQRTVAVKFLLADLGLKEDYADRFRREAVAMAAIRDQNVAQIFTYGDLQGRPYFVMEHLDGSTVERFIDDHLNAGEFVPLGDVLDIMWQVLSGLAEIHRSGAVHRDIKPANVMLIGDPRRAVIVDFGLVRDVLVEDESVALAGTPAYIAPELVEGRSGADRSPLVDVYSAGATAYELLTGSIPFTGDNWVQILHSHINETLEPPSTRRQGLPAEIDDIVLRAMARDPADRYQSADDFLAQLLLIEESSEAATRSPRPITGSGRIDTGRGRLVTSSAPAARAQPVAPAEPGLLVYDRDPAFRGLVEGTTRVAVPGCRVLTVAEQEPALASLSEFAPSVAVLDVTPTDPAGLELAAAIRGNPECEDVEVIVVADEGTGPEAEALEWLGLRYLMEKPLDVISFAELVRGILGKGPLPQATKKGRDTVAMFTRA